MTQTCGNCGLTNEEIDTDDIVVGPIGGGKGSSCTICRADELREKTVLSKQEAKVAAHKQITGATHETVADRLGLDKSTVDEYSRRINEKVQKAANTTNELRDR